MLAAVLSLVLQQVRWCWEQFRGGTGGDLAEPAVGGADLGSIGECHNPIFLSPASHTQSSSEPAI